MSVEVKEASRLSFFFTPENELRITSLLQLSSSLMIKNVQRFNKELPGLNPSSPVNYQSLHLKTFAELMHWFIFPMTLIFMLDIPRSWHYPQGTFLTLSPIERRPAFCKPQPGGRVSGELSSRG